MTGPDAGKPFLPINPQGNVPCLVIDGVVLAEGPAVLQWIADAAPEAKLAPANGTLARYEMQAALSFVGTDLHAGSFGPLFNPAFAATKEATLAKLSTKLAFLASHWLEGGKKHYLIGGDAPTVADLYAYIVTSWCPYVGAPDLATAHPVLAAYRARIAALPWVAEAHAAMAAASPKA